VKRALPYVKRALLCIEPYIYYISHVNPKEPYSVTIQKRPTLCEKGLAMHAKFPITRKTSLLHVKKPYYMQKIPLTRKKIPITRTNSLLHLKNPYYMYKILSTRKKSLLHVKKSLLHVKKSLLHVKKKIAITCKKSTSL